MTSEREVKPSRIELDGLDPEPEGSPEAIDPDLSPAPSPRPRIVVLGTGADAPAEGATAAETPAPEAVPQPPKPQPIGPGDSWDLAARLVLGRHAHRLLGLDDAIRMPEARDELRRYRVAARRLRAGLQVFESAFPASQAGSIRRGLRDVARRVGTVRDLDVRIADLEAWSDARFGGAERVAPLHASWTAERAAAFDRLLAALADDHHGRLLRRVAAMLAPEAVPDDAFEPTAAQDRVLDHAAGAVWEAYAGLRATGPELRLADAAKLHEVRIAAKRLRYTLEFLGDALGPETPDLIARLTGLQDRLGAANDAVTTGMAVAGFLGQRSDRLTDRERRGIVAYQVAALNSLARSRRSAPPAWRAVASPAFARRLAAASSGIATVP